MGLFHLSTLPKEVCICWRELSTWFRPPNKLRTPDFFLSIFRKRRKVIIELPIILIKSAARTSESEHPSSSSLWSDSKTIHNKTLLRKIIKKIKKSKNIEWREMIMSWWQYLPSWITYLAGGAHLCSIHPIHITRQSCLGTGPTLTLSGLSYTILFDHLTIVLTNDQSNSVDHFSWSQARASSSTRWMFNMKESDQAKVNAQTCQTGG